MVVGIFQTTTGAIGTIDLKIAGNKFEGTASQVTPWVHRDLSDEGER